MATIAGKGTKAGSRPSFHLWMVLAMSAFVFGGFGMTYLGPMAMGTRPPDSFVVHLHGAVFFAWMVLLIVQTALVNAKNVRLHRSLGTFGIAVGTLVFFMGWMMQIVSASITQLGGAGPGVFFLGLVAPPSFAIIFAMAIRAVRTPVVHRNLILIATVAILMPGINRVYATGFGYAGVPFYQTYATMDAFLALILWHERKVTGRISGMTWTGAAIVFVPQLFMELVSSTEWWRELVFALGRLIEYH
jgi:hypothetical protein